MAKAFNWEEAKTVVAAKLYIVVSALWVGQAASRTVGHWKDIVLLPGVGALGCQDSWSGIKSDGRQKSRDPEPTRAGCQPRLGS